ncbi:somatotropin isoform X1 [Phyllopteryx taeniolatus]|uniref:somatotropin isoform X1 n=1 Tax=Phyllopteryx taeniolatus TaxID=161469 RepID=UPI002AD3CC65|nr:somatotropin isoform X1 [Phyllopteryx taeniolatus]
MDKVLLFLSLVTLAGVSSQSITDSQRVFSIAVSRVQHLHLLAQRLFSDFESSLQNEDQRQLNKIFLQDFCNSDYIISPLDKHETQRSSVLKLLSISYRLVESWEFPSRSLSGGSAPRNQVSSKLSELKMGILLLIRLFLQANQDAAEMLADSSALQLAPYGNYYQSVADDEPLRRMYELLACFKKDMHKVETYLTVAKCRLSPEANCTL